MGKKQEKVLGYAQFGAYMHRDQGGKMRIAAYTSVNKPLSVEAHDETTKIAQRQYKIVEDEQPILSGNTFYTKDVWNEQSGDSETASHKSDSPYGNSKPEVNKDGLTPLQVLKNFVDNIAADVRNHGWMILAIAVIAAVALGLAIAK